jgi:hypothetical protein
MRYDENNLGGRDNRYDTVCPICFAAIGAPCTVKKLDGREFVKWTHEERKQDGVDQTGPE